MRTAIEGITLALLVAMLLLAPEAGLRDAVAADRAATPRWHGAARVEVLGVDNRGATLGGKEFTAEAVRYLRLIVWWNVVGVHRQRLELYAPDGSLYQQFSTAFDGDDVHFRQRGGQSPWTRVETKLLVGGTWITEYGVFGTWRMDVYLDGASAPMASEEFVLTPRDTSRQRGCRSRAIC